MDKIKMIAMEKVRQSGVCNMFDGDCVRKELSSYGIEVSRKGCAKLLKDFRQYKEEEVNNG